MDAENVIASDMDRMARGLDSAAERAAREIGKFVKRVAVSYAPKAPTRTLLKRLRKTKRKTKRNPRATSWRTPGGLERSITFEPDSSGVDILVPANSEAGKYAVFIHDGGPNGTGDWQNRGPGTVAKGDQAGDKFIERAITDNEAEINKIMRNEMDRVMDVK